VATRRELLRRAAAGARHSPADFFSTTPSATDEDIVNETIRDLSYDWRELDPEETLRFFALRLVDAKLITSTAPQIVAQGSDFAYMRQLRTELKH
jgi:hypothetical protein